MEVLWHTLLHALMITGFVFMMMLFIEYVNILSQGVWQTRLEQNRWGQYLLAAFLGATPGCLGAFAVVALYSHGTVTLGAVVAAMIATSGDESFVMLSMFPKTALAIFSILAVIGIVCAAITDLFIKPDHERPFHCDTGFQIHTHEAFPFFSTEAIRRQWSKCSPARGILAFLLLLFLIGVISGNLGPPVWNWIRITLVVVCMVCLFIVTTVPDHFLEEHLWKHVVMEHVPRIFLWTFGALLAMHLLIEQFHMQAWLDNNRFIVMVIACLLGIIPESGPHMIFVTLFAENAIPFSTLLASSLVQDGHGMLPMLAESRKDFIRIKAINLAAGLIVGTAGLLAGW